MWTHLDREAVLPELRSFKRGAGYEQKIWSLIVLNTLPRSTNFHFGRVAFEDL